MFLLQGVLGASRGSEDAGAQAYGGSPLVRQVWGEGGGGRPSPERGGQPLRTPGCRSVSRGAKGLPRDTRSTELDVSEH